MLRQYAQRCVLLGGGTTVLAANTSQSVDLDGGRLTINTEERKLIFTPAGSKHSELLFSVGTVSKKSYKGESYRVIKTGTWDVYDIGQKSGSNEIVMDLSMLSNMKDNYIMIKLDDLGIGWSDMETTVCIKIPAADKVVKTSYNPVEKELTVLSGKSKNSLHSAEAYEYRTSTSSWIEGEEVNEKGIVSDVFEEYLNRGATLYVRTPGSSVSRFYGDDGEESIYEIEQVLNPTDPENGPSDELCIWKTDPLPGKEIKLTIPKQANPPVVKANYVNREITLPKNSEYRVVTRENFTEDFSGYFKVGSIQKNNTNKALIKNVSDIFDENTKANSTLEVRIAADPAKKKAASKWARTVHYMYIEWNDSIVHQGINGSVGGAYIQFGGQDEDGTTSTIGPGGIEITYPHNRVWAEYGKVKKNDDYNLVSIKNTTDASAFEIVVVAKDQSLDEGIKSSKNIKKLRDRTGRVVSELKLKNIEEGSKIYIRMLGDNKTKRWEFSNYLKLGEVIYPKQSMGEE